MSNIKFINKLIIFFIILTGFSSVLADEIELNFNKYAKNSININANNKNDLNYTNLDSAQRPTSTLGFKYKFEDEENNWYLEYKQYSQIQPLIQYAKVYFGPLKTYLQLEGDLSLKLKQRNIVILKDYNMKINSLDNLKLIYGGQLSNLNIAFINLDDFSEVSSYFISPFIRLRAETNRYTVNPIYMEISGHTSLKNTNYKNSGADFLLGKSVYSENNFSVNIELKRKSIKINYDKNRKIIKFSNFGNNLALVMLYKFH
jgi:hypothetical protein